MNENNTLDLTDIVFDYQPSSILSDAFEKALKECRSYFEEYNKQRLQTWAILKDKFVGYK